MYGVFFVLSIGSMFACLYGWIEWLWNVLKNSRSEKVLLMICVCASFFFFHLICQWFMNRYHSLSKLIPLLLLAIRVIFSIYRIPKFHPLSLAALNPIWSTRHSKYISHYLIFSMIDKFRYPSKKNLWPKFGLSSSVRETPKKYVIGKVHRWTREILALRIVRMTVRLAWIKIRESSNFNVCLICYWHIWNCWFEMCVNKNAWLLILG